MQERTPLGRAAPRRWLDKASTSSSCRAPGAADPDDTRARLDVSLRETTRAQFLLSEEKSRSNVLEMRLAERTEQLAIQEKTIDKLVAETKTMKRDKQRVEDEIAQLSLDFINGQTTVVQTREKHSEEVSKLTETITELQFERDKLAEELKKHKLLDSTREKRREIGEMETKQNNLFNQELKQLLKQTQEKCAVLKAENEVYCKLFVEKTVSGDISASSTSSASLKAKNNEKDEPDTIEEGKQEQVAQLTRELTALREKHSVLIKAHEQFVARAIENRSLVESAEEQISPSAVRSFCARTSSRLDPDIEIESKPRIDPFQWNGRVFLPLNRRNTNLSRRCSSSSSEAGSETSESSHSKPPSVEISRLENVTGTRKLRLG